MCSGGTKPALSRPCACNVACHWQSLMSVLRPGRFLTYLPLTITTRSPPCSRTSYGHSQYTPVASMATERTPCSLSQSRKACSCPVVVPKTFGAPPATETCSCSLPTSMAAAVASRTVKEGVGIDFSSVASARRARLGSEKNKSFQREAKLTNQYTCREPEPI